MQAIDGRYRHKNGAAYAKFPGGLDLGVDISVNAGDVEIEVELYDCQVVTKEDPQKDPRYSLKGSLWDRAIDRDPDKRRRFFDMKRDRDDIDGDRDIDDTCTCYNFFSDAKVESDPLRLSLKRKDGVVGSNKARVSSAWDAWGRDVEGRDYMRAIQSVDVDKTEGEEQAEEKREKTTKRVESRAKVTSDSSRVKLTSDNRVKVTTRTLVGTGHIVTPAPFSPRSSPPPPPPPRPPGGG
jgi:hypothetical protein